MAQVLSPERAPAGENPPVPPDTQEGPGEASPGEAPPGHDPTPDPSEDAPGTDEGHPESPTKGLAERVPLLAVAPPEL